MQQILEFLNKKKYYFILIIVIILAVIGRNKLLQNPDQFVTYTLHKMTLSDSVKVSGTYQTAMRKSILSTANGVISEAYVQNGDFVIEGEPLVYIKSTATDLEIAEAYANYTKALNTLNTAKQSKLSLQSQIEQARQSVLDAQAGVDDLEYHLAYGDDNASTKRQYTQEEKDSKQSRLTSAREAFTAVERQFLDSDQAISTAYAGVQSAKLLYDATQSIVINAPTSGTVVNFLKKVGDEVSLNQNPIMVITNGLNPSITVSVNEIYMPKIQINQSVEVVFDAFKDKVFHGVVENFETLGRDTNGSIDYDVKINVLDISNDILPEMTATVSIETYKKDDVLAVPNGAILVDGERSFVFLTDQNHKQINKIEVITGDVTSEMTEILSGLSEGDIIITNIDLI